jgi:hypothetical protein
MISCQSTEIRSHLGCAGGDLVTGLLAIVFPRRDEDGARVLQAAPSSMSQVIRSYRK